jgi:hypothetical protein
MNVHATKKLLAKLPLNETARLSNDLPMAANDAPGLGDWHANLILLQRRQCVLFVHDVTRFAVFVPCLTKPDFARLDWHFQDVLMNTLLKTDLSPELLDKATRFLSPLRFDNNCNRSVQGTMNQMAQDLDYGLYYDHADISDLLPYSTSRRLSDRPCTAKGVKDWIWPIPAMHEWLAALPE